MVQEKSEMERITWVRNEEYKAVGLSGWDTRKLLLFIYDRTHAL